MRRVGGCGVGTNTMTTTKKPFNTAAWFRDRAGERTTIEGMYAENRTLPHSHSERGTTAQSLNWRVRVEWSRGFALTRQNGSEGRCGRRGTRVQWRGGGGLGPAPSGGVGDLRPTQLPNPYLVSFLGERDNNAHTEFRLSWSSRIRVSYS